MERLSDGNCKPKMLSRSANTYMIGASVFGIADSDQSVWNGECGLWYSTECDMMRGISGRDWSR